MRDSAKHAVFISYRRDDARGWPGRLEADLVDWFGPRRVFRDIGIPAGVDYEEHIERVLDGCSVMLAVIGPDWTTVSAPDGAPRLTQPHDLLREEIERALRRRDVTVIPVLVGGATMPARAELPESLRALARLQATTLSEQSWDHDVGVLVERLFGLLGEKPRRFGSRARLIFLATMATLVAVAAGMFTLRDSILPNESGQAEASLVDYRRSIGAVCKEIGVGDRGAVAIGRRLHKRLRSARTILAQRNALLDAVRATNARSGYELSRFKGIAAPSSQARRHRATLVLWTAGQLRVMAYQRRLDGVGDKAGLDRSIRYLRSIRPKLARNGVDLRAGLLRLGGGSCVLKPPIVLDTITLPALPPAAHKPRSRSGPKSGGAAAETLAESAEANPTTAVAPPPPLPPPPSPRNVRPPVSDGGAESFEEEEASRRTL